MAGTNSDGRKLAIGGNWKMNLDLAGALKLASELRNRLGSHRGAEVLVFPPYPFLHPVVERLRNSAIAVGGQDLSTEASGAFTGAVSTSMLRSVGCTHVLVGHSERRAVFGDDNATVARKLRVALDGGLIPVLCIGETFDQRQAGETFEILGAQLDTALDGLDADTLSDMIIAYEPVWAIGTGKVASPEQAEEVHADLRKQLTERYNSEIANSVRILYGGSVKPDNAAELLRQANIDGALIGGASLQADDFLAIATAGAAAVQA